MDLPMLFRRYIDDLFLLFDNKSQMVVFMNMYNNMHP